MRFAPLASATQKSSTKSCRSVPISTGVALAKLSSVFAATLTYHHYHSRHFILQKPRTIVAVANAASTKNSVQMSLRPERAFMMPSAA